MPARQVDVPRGGRSTLSDPFGWRRRIAAAVAFGLLCLTRVASAADGSSAKEAYEKGVEEFRAGNFETACRLLADSYRAEPLPGVLFTWATCELRADRVASAAQHYGDFLDATSRLLPADRSAQDERRQVAQRERARILPEVPYLTIVVASDAGGTSTVRRDGEVLAPNALGVEQAVDPGAHVIDYEGADGVRAQQRVVLAKGEHKTIVVGFAKPAEPTLPAAALAAPPPKLYERSVTPWIYVTGGVGVAGLVTGSIAGALALRDKSTVDDKCTGRACSQQGFDAADAAKLESTVSTVGFAVGAAGIIATVIVYVADACRGGSAQAAPASRFSVVAIAPGVLGLGGAF